LIIIFYYIYSIADLHNHPDQIGRIGELLNINSLKHLHELLGIKFIASRFNQMGELSETEEEENKLQKNLPQSENKQEDGLSKSAKKKLKKDKLKTSKTLIDDEQKIGTKESKNEQQKMIIQKIPQELVTEGKESLKEIEQSHHHEDEQNASNASLQSQLTVKK